MSFLDNAKIRTKVLALLGLLGCLCLALSWYASSAIRGVDDSYSSLVDVKLPSTTKLARVQRLSTEMVYSAYQAIAYDGSTAEARRTVGDEAEAYRGAKTLLSELQTSRPDYATELGEIGREVDEVHQIAASAIPFGLRNDNATATQRLAAADRGLARLKKLTVGLNEAASAEAKRTSEELSASSASTATTQVIVSVIGIGLVMGLAIWLVKVGVSAPIARLEESMRVLAGGNNRLEVPGTNRGDEVGSMAKAVLVFRDAAVAQEIAAVEKQKADADQKAVVDCVGKHLGMLAKGDLTAEIEQEFPQSYAALKTNFNGAISNLRELIASVAESTLQIRTGSGEIAQAAEDLARRTESNAASLEETSAAITEMDGRLKATAQAAEQTVQRADQASATVGTGRSMADQAVASMNRVSSSAKGIDDVIEGLDKIAFQTRVLAMNAAVEAGRAGDAGRGFAVVADLVSALAMRAEEEAKRARDQLTVTQTDIGAAVEAVGRVDSALAEISTDVSEVNNLLSKIARDNQTQASAVTQINAAVSSMDAATQQNAAMVEETSAAARNLSAEVQGLAEQASRFDTGRPSSAMSHSPKKSAALLKLKEAGAPIKKLPKAAVQALTPPDEAWTEF